jgi:hypothetical protein
MDNANPRIKPKVSTRIITIQETDHSVVDKIDAREGFGMSIMANCIGFQVHNCPIPIK